MKRRKSGKMDRNKINLSKKKKRNDYKIWHGKQSVNVCLLKKKHPCQQSKRLLPKLVLQRKRSLTQGQQVLVQ